LDTIKLKALLHIQKFIGWEEDPYNVIGLPGGGSWKRVEDEGGAKVFIAESKMNSRNEDEEDENMEDAPF
jgi:replicative DNA helicase